MLSCYPIDAFSINCEIISSIWRIENYAIKISYKDQTLVKSSAEGQDFISTFLSSNLAKWGKENIKTR